MEDAVAARGRIGPYKAERRLGSGAFATVWQAVDRNGNHVAVKVLHDEIAADPVAVRTLQQDLLATRRIRSRHVAVPIAWELDESPMYVAYPLVAGRTLRDVLAESPGGLTPIQVLTVADELAMAAADVHRAGIAHRDISTANVMVTGSWQIRLIDFGLATLGNNSRFSRAVAGVVEMFSPEELAYLSNPDSNPPDFQAVDVWRIGLVLLEATEDIPAIRSERRIFIAADVARDGRELRRRLAHLAPELRRVIHSCLTVAEKRVSAEKLSSLARTTLTIEAHRGGAQAYWHLLG